MANDLEYLRNQENWRWASYHEPIPHVDLLYHDYLYHQGPALVGWADWVEKFPFGRTWDDMWADFTDAVVRWEELPVSRAVGKYRVNNRLATSFYAMVIARSLNGARRLYRLKLTQVSCHECNICRRNQCMGEWIRAAELIKSTIQFRSK